MKCLLLGLAGVLACGDDGQERPAPDAQVADAAPAGALAITSTAFTSGAAIPVLHTCKDTTAQKDSSPPLAWTGAPAAARSFAVVLTDNSIGRVHWAIFDIAPTTTALPLNIDKVYAPAAVPGAHQVSADTSFHGYQGPCPPSKHEYEFAIYALDATTLPGAAMTIAAKDLVPIIQAHMLATAKITVTFTP